MILYHKCGFFNEEANEKDVPTRCDECYRYDLCKESFINQTELKYRITVDGNVIYNNKPISADKESIRAFIFDIANYMYLIGLVNGSIKVRTESLFCDDTNKHMIEEMIEEVNDYLMRSGHLYMIDNLSFDGGI